MHQLFIILDYISVFIMIGCVFIVATHESSKMQKLALLTCVMLLFSCTGFLIKGEGVTVDVMITGQKIVYATVTHSMLLMLLFILEYCKISIPKTVKWICHGVNLLITLIVLTLDHHKLFYVKYWVEDINGNAELMKEYGPAHTLAVAVFVLYMVAALVVAIVFSIKNIRERSRYVWRLLVAVSLPCIAYAIPKITDTVNELQPIAFSLFTVLLIQMVYKSKIYDVNDIATQYALKSVSNALIVFGEEYSYKGCNKVATDLFPLLADISIDKDMRLKSEFLCDCVDGKISEYSANDKIFNISVRPVDVGGTAIGKVVWFEDVTIERNYTKLLKAQKQDLETRVETLYDISNTDDMTGLANRRYYEQCLSNLREKDDISNVTVAEIDLNGLKELNDTIGHKAGDEIIIGTANILTSVFSKCGKIFRTGGDEFFVIIEDGSVDIKTLTDELENACGNWQGKLINSLSFSYGFASAKDFPDKTIDDLMLIADKTMYKNKAEYYLKSGKDRRNKIN